MAAPGWRDDGPARFSTWLYRVVLNASIDRRRRRSFAPLDEASDAVDDAPSGYDDAMACERRHLVLSAIAQLPERQRAALSLHYFAEISAREVAEILGVSLSALEALLVRGKRALRKDLTGAGISGLGDVL